jgi:hypothetical protein
MEEIITCKTLYNDFIFLNGFFTRPTLNRLFLWTTFKTKPIFTTIFKIVKLFFIYVATPNMEEFFTLKTRNIPQMCWNIFAAIAATT